MPDMSKTRQLAAIMFTDIQGYTALMQQDEERAIEIRERHREIFNNTTEKFNGKILQYYGDGTLSIFNSAIDAVNCAIEMQLAFQQEPVIPVRIGIHLGDIIYSDEEIIGDGVNVASRIESLAVPGSIFISDKVYYEIKNQPKIQTQSLKTFKLKNVERPVEVYAISNKGLVIPKAYELDGAAEEKEKKHDTFIEEKYESKIPGDLKEHIHIHKPKKKLIIIGSGVFLIIVCLIIYLIWSTGNFTSLELEKSIAVLPFQNMSDNEEYAFFGDALTDEIIMQLYKINEFEVRSRTSIMQYKGTEKTSPVIAQELKVNYLIEGTAQRYGNQVRILVQLIHAQTDKHLWGNTYEKEWKDILDIQSEIAQQIAHELKAVLSPEEIEQIEKKPTDNLEAYDYYLRGNDYYWRSPAEQDISIAIRMYEKAIELDKNFALAYTMLAQAYTKMYWVHYDRSKNILIKSRQAIDMAFEINPNLPEAHLALGLYYYWGYLKYSKALEQFEIVLEHQPNNSECHASIAYVHRRAGNWEKAKVSIKKALELDPGSLLITYATGETFYLLREYAEAEYYFNQVIMLSPDLFDPYWYKIHIYLNSKGNTNKARLILEEASQMISSTKDPLFIEIRVLLDVYDGNYQEPLKYLSLESFDAFQLQFYYKPQFLLYARIYNLMNKPELAYAYYDSTRIFLESKLIDYPEDSRLHSSLGIAYAGLGQKEKAINAGKKAVELLPISKEAWRGVYRAGDLAQIYVMVGEYEAALKQIELLLSIPGHLSTKLLQLDPIWKPLWNHPEFKRLIEIYSEN